MKRVQSESFWSLERHSDRTALIEDRRTVSYGELVHLADAFAERLGGDRSLIYLEADNSVDAIAAYCACLRGGHAVHLYRDYDEATLSLLMRQYEPNLLIRSDGERHGVETISTQPAQMHPDLRVLLSTSGSTGSPKFVKLSARNISSNADSIAQYLGLSIEDRSITSLKFNYSYGMSVINSHLASGSSIILTEASVTSPEFWRIFETQRATSFAGVPYTFEILAKTGKLASLRGLRHVTQAGGRLAAEHVRHFAALGRQHGWKFFVMYGQTEASPRMAYLPPDMAEQDPDAIGHAIPGGNLFLLDDADSPNGIGEIAYSGPNVMMGYAETRADLAGDETPAILRTGDLGVQQPNGLFRIVGRASRIIKPFGVRINLDEVQQQLRMLYPGAVCAGNDEWLAIAVPADTCSSPPADIRTHASRAYKLPPFAVRVIGVATAPLLVNGKLDYKAVEALAAREEQGAMANRRPMGPIERATAILSTSTFYKRVLFEAASIFGLVKPDWKDIASIYAAILHSADVSEESSFTSLAGDSLSYVRASIAVEEYLGFLPENWANLHVEDLEKLRSHETIL